MGSKSNRTLLAELQEAAELAALFQLAQRVSALTVSSARPELLAVVAHQALVERMHRIVTQLDELELRVDDVEPVPRPEFFRAEFSGEEEN